MYRVIVSVDPKIIGAKDGSSLIITDAFSLNSYKAISSVLNVKDDLILDCFKFVDKAKQIDVLSCANNYNTSGIIVSDKVRVILEKYNLHSTQFIPCVLHKNGSKISGFSLLHCYSYLLDKIDYDRTTFSRIWPFPKEIEESYGYINENKFKEEITKCIGRVAYVSPDSGYYFKDFDLNNFDLFKVGYAENFLYFSERLKRDLEFNKVIGFEYLQIGNYFNL